MEKIKAGIFEGPQVRQFIIIKLPAFMNLMNEADVKAWILFAAVIENFLGKCKAENYVDVSNSLGAT